MKQSYFLLLLLVMLLVTSCKKEKANPVNQLPPTTQEGKLTFGCLINGKPFTPKASSIVASTPLNCYYQYVDGAYYFHVSAFDRSQPNVSFGVGINTESLSISVGSVIPLTKGDIGEASGLYVYSDATVRLEEYITNNEIIGELKITHLDEEEQIVSGTFWFDAVNSSGKKVEIREGRFDMQYMK
jgi:hypothetical protein